MTHDHAHISEHLLGYSSAWRAINAEGCRGSERIWRLGRRQPSLGSDGDIGAPAEAKEVHSDPRGLREVQGPQAKGVSPADLILIRDLIPRPVRPSSTQMLKLYQGERRLRDDQRHVAHGAGQRGPVTLG
jgi:hypothetical protein